MISGATAALMTTTMRDHKRNGTSEIRIRGKNVLVPAAQIDDATVIVVGKVLKIASVKDEYFVGSQPVQADPEGFVRKLRQQRLKAHVFTFSQWLPDVQPKFDYPIDWDNVAAIRTHDFDAWWNSLPQETRKNVRRAQKRGVVVKSVELDDAFVRGVTEIYNESPLRQGKPFHHYGKDFATIKREISTFAETSKFIGAYKGEELVGFIKLIHTGPIANIMHIVAKQAHSDARPTNALLAEAVSLCAKKGLSYLIYGYYTYGRKTDSSLAEFKRRHGFEKVLIPTYCIPLTIAGRLIVGLKLHRGVVGILPPRLTSLLLSIRARVLQAVWGARSSDSLLSSDS
jgi:hypothetical protein